MDRGPQLLHPGVPLRSGKTGRICAGTRAQGLALAGQKRVAVCGADGNWGGLRAEGADQRRGRSNPGTAADRDPPGRSDAGRRDGGGPADELAQEGEGAVAGATVPGTLEYRRAVQRVDDDAVVRAERAGLSQSGVVRLLRDVAGVQRAGEGEGGTAKRARQCQGG